MRDKSLSPVEYLEALIERIERLEPTLNAVADRRYDEARVEAAGAAQRYANGTARALDGVPVAAKEEHPMVGRVVVAGVAGAGRRGGAARPSDHRAHPGRRRHHPHPHHDPRVLLRAVLPQPALGHHPQPVEHRVLARRVVGRLGRSARRGLRAAGHRLRHRWLDPHPGVAQRGHRVQAAVGSRACVAAVQPRPVLPRRPAGAHRRRLCAVAGRDLRPPLARRVALANPPQVTGAGDDVRGLRVALCVRLGDWPLDDGVEANTRASRGAARGRRRGWSRR